ncbi:baculoviral IAP repeat-containing protein 7-B-like [Pecten maximus]|uniref:baculoviral IAP repeat-containing protein 7-B-like n=1 Tax=Pecten maximus TaxID=6579 RepID=UPI001458E63D|nr:baculoviral IAP repeat-containing protein 7-B-like [Pecten maximus]XP_033741285.1 baculoviral IAP repeat-containing protein 7-B-like [Pecten maximus]
MNMASSSHPLTLTAPPSNPLTLTTPSSNPLTLTALSSNPITLTATSSLPITLTAETCFPENDFSHQLSRLYSFRKFPNEYYTIFLTKLVNAGFYYILYQDLVRCFSCGLDLHVAELTELDNVGEIHQTRSPGCVFVFNHNRKQNDLGAGMSNAAFPNFFIGATRLTSLKKSGILPSSAVDLAKNGLFFDETRKKVRCFHCGTKVHQHNNHLCMCREHARKSPNCTFLRQNPTNVLTDWKVDGPMENADTEIRPPSSRDIMLERAACNKRLICVICQQNEKNATFLPCHHSCLCKGCLLKIKPRHCLVCKLAIDNVFFFQLESLST